MAEHLDPMEIPCILCGAENKQEVTVPLSLCEEHEDADVNARVPCLQRQLQQAQQDLAKERENGLREANACEQARLAALRAHDDLAEAQAERDAAQAANAALAAALGKGLDEEIKVVAAATPKGGGDSYYRGRLSGLLFVRDRILYDANSAALTPAEALGRQAR